jgi:5-(carboxyamino)imidazole ribonucleotide synthase
MSSTKPSPSPVPPGGTIGILGGGQLGRMLALAAARLGLKTHIFAASDGECAGQVADAYTAGRFDDEVALVTFASTCDAATFEFENVPADAVEVLSRRLPIHPSAKALRIAQDRFEEKTFAVNLTLQTAPFEAIDGAADIDAAFARIGGGRAILKTRRFGYDGKGQAKVSSAADAKRAFETFKQAPAILEGFVPFAFECSVIAARGADGQFEAYDPPENAHENHILRRSTVPGLLTERQCHEAKDIAQRIADALDYVGVLAVELFVTKEGQLLVNEIAPRVHNSGHWTLDACAVSQFEQHIRAIAGWPLGNPARHSDATMTNLIGEEANDWKKLAAHGGALHLYGKGEARPGRKMGHITHLSPRG